MSADEPHIGRVLASIEQEMDGDYEIGLTPADVDCPECGASMGRPCVKGSS